MTGRLKLLYAQIKTRLSAGGIIEEVLKDYPLLTEHEKNAIKQEAESTT